jgi:hypothetical protein
VSSDTQYPVLTISYTVDPLRFSVGKSKKTVNRIRRALEGNAFLRFLPLPTLICAFLFSFLDLKMNQDTVNRDKFESIDFNRPRMTGLTERIALYRGKIPRTPFW